MPPSSIQQLPIFDIIADAEKEGTNIVQVIMYDRFSADGKPRSFDASSDLSALFPVKARFLKAMGGADHKGVLVRGLIEPTGNFHNWKGQVVHSEVLEFAHYNGQTGLSIGCGLTTELQVKQEFLARLSIRGCWTITSGTAASPGRSSAENWPQAPTDHDHANRLYGTQDVKTIFATVEFCSQTARHGMA